MNCDQVQQDLLHRDWTDDDLQAARAMLAHLDACADCRRAVGQYDQLRQALAGENHDAAPAPAGGWAAFEHRLAGHVAAPASRVAWRVSMAMAAAIALLLAGYGLATLAHHATTPGGGPPAGPVAVQPSPDVRFTPRDTTAHASTFREVSEVFGGQAQWVMLSERGSDVGIAQRPIAPARTLFLVRLVLTHDDRGVATSDVAIVPGQSADLRVPLENGRSIRYRIGTSGLDAAQLSLWAELTDADGGAAQPIAALATHLHVAPGQSASAGEMNTVSGPYRLSVAFAQADLNGSTPR